MFKDQYQQYLDLIEEKLASISAEEKISSKYKVSESVRYSLLAGGKRIRPVLTLAVALSLGANLSEDLVHFACIVEMIHNYSLIHDDLPAMDNDELRRGKPTNHMVFGEDTAIIAGDGLLNLAYENLLALCLENPKLLKAASRIAFEAGINGMVGGQSLDLYPINSSQQEENLNYLIELQNLKTGALIRAAILAGYYFVEANENQANNLSQDLEKIYEEYANKIGLEFQIRDDILDVLSSKETLGKSIGKDERDQKLTFVTLLGLEEAQKYEEKLNREIYEILNSLKMKNINVTFLTELTDFLLNRNY